MKGINIRNVPDAVHRALRLRAAKNGRSMEAEAREILKAAVAAKSPPFDLRELQAYVAKHFPKTSESETDAFIAERRREARREEEDL